MKRARICILLALTLVFVLGFGSPALATTPFSASINEGFEGFQITPPGDVWTATKSASPDVLSLAAGESKDVTYQVTVNKTAGEGDPVVTGEVKATFGTTVGVNEKAKLDITVYVTENGQEIDGTSKTFSNQDPDEGPYSYDYTPTFSPSLGKTYKIVYSGTVQKGTPWYGSWYWHSVHNLNGDLGISVVEGTNDTPSMVTVEDVMELPAGITTEYTGWTEENVEGVDKTYTISFKNSSAEPGDYMVTNTIKIDSTDATTESVSINVPQKEESDPTPKPTKKPDPPEPREERKVRWPDRTPPPEELDTAADAVAVELPKTGGLIEWEWLALAGGMLASGGGALYLVRRRKINK